MRIFQTHPLPDPAADLLAEHEVVVAPEDQRPDHAALVAEAARSQALVCLLRDPVDEAVLAAGAAAGTLKVVGNYAVGVDNVDLDAARRLGVAVVNTPDVLTEATADLTFALILAITRRLLEGDKVMRRQAFPGWTPQYLLGSGLQGRTLGIVGLGRIGRAVARRARAFGMQLVHSSRSPVDPEVVAALDSREVDFAELVAVSDVVSLHAPLTEATHHLVDAEVMAAMKPSAYLINTSRGPLVDEAALVEALARGQLAGAGLDVFEDEPRVHPGLIGLENVVMVPHVGSATHEARAGMARLVASGVAAVLAGERPPNLVVPPP